MEYYEITYYFMILKDQSIRLVSVTINGQELCFVTINYKWIFYENEKKKKLNTIIV